MIKVRIKYPQRLKHKQRKYKNDTCLPKEEASLFNNTHVLEAVSLVNKVFGILVQFTQKVTAYLLFIPVPIKFIPIQ